MNRTQDPSRRLGDSGGRLPLRSPFNNHVKTPTPANIRTPKTDFARQIAFPLQNSKTVKHEEQSTAPVCSLSEELELPGHFALPHESLPTGRMAPTAGFSQLQFQAQAQALTQTQAHAQILTRTQTQTQAEGQRRGQGQGQAQGTGFKAGSGGLTTRSATGAFNGSRTPMQSRNTMQGMSRKTTTTTTGSRVSSKSKEKIKVIIRLRPPNELVHPYPYLHRKAQKPLTR